MKLIIKRTVFDFVSFFQSNLGRQVLFYLFFYIVLWGFHIVLISLVSFFHLLLDHSIRTIGDWIGDRGWTLIIISKLTVLYLALQFINLKTKKFFSVKSYFRNSIQNPRVEVFVVLFFLLLGLIGVGDIKYNSTMIVELDRTLLSLAGTFIFFSVDYILLVILDVFYPVREEEMRKRRIFIMPLFFYLFSAATFVYEQNISFKLYAFFLLLIYAGEWRRKNWTLPAIYLVFFLLPCFSFLGLDPVWGEIYSPFFASRHVSSATLFILVLFGLSYLHFTAKKKPEYIYRD